MINFVNAKINIGLDVTARRPDGYHDLSTVFYPVGVYAGTPQSPYPFGDILEICPSATDTEFIFKGRKVDCPLEKNLVVKAYRLYHEKLQQTGVEARNWTVILEKHLPDAAGLGGGSADASFTLRSLNHLYNAPFSTAELEEMALKLGADCPVFIRNEAAYAEGVGEKLCPISLPLKGRWIVLAKPDIAISTKEAFAGIKPQMPTVSLREEIKKPLCEWHKTIKNDFEANLFPKYPVLAELKERMYRLGAEFALMSGSGSTIYGIFSSEETALSAMERISEPWKAICML